MTAFKVASHSMTDHARQNQSTTPPMPAVIAPLSKPDLLSIVDLSRAEIEMVFATAASVKADIGPYNRALAGQSVIMLFEKASLRTRVTFEVGVFRLGGQAIYFDHSSSRIGEREAIKDYGANLDRWVHGIVARVYRHVVLEELAAAARVPVINALSEKSHPCQALADLFTLREHLGDLKGRSLAYIGDGNNVCRSLMLASATLGVHMTVITPEGYGPGEEAAALARSLGASSGARLTLSHDPGAVAGSDAVYTDTWVSMGAESEAAERAAAFAPFQVNEALMKRAGSSALFMHCLPAKRGVEVTDDVVDDPYSIVLDQAENRLHIQNALLLHLLAPGFRPGPHPAGGPS